MWCSSRATLRSAPTAMNLTTPLLLAVTGTLATVLSPVAVIAALTAAFGPA
jgi:hypothetical protein